jgi:hypothetical protein
MKGGLLKNKKRKEKEKESLFFFGENNRKS